MPSRDTLRIRRAILVAMERAARVGPRAYDDAFLSIAQGMDDAARSGLAAGAKGTGLTFDVPIDGAMQFARNRAMQIVFTLRNDAEAVAGSVRAALRGFPVAEQRAMLAAVAGLDARLSQAVFNYRLSLEAAHQKPATIRRLVLDYGDRLRAYRANMMARTEAVIAENAGKEIAWSYAQARGLLSRTQLRMWVIADDERTCPVCMALDGTKVPLGQPFVAGGASVVTPGLVHPHCRCTEVLVSS